MLLKCRALFGVAVIFPSSGMELQFMLHEQFAPFAILLTQQLSLLNSHV